MSKYKYYWNRGDAYPSSDGFSQLLRCDHCKCEAPVSYYAGNKTYYCELCAQCNDDQAFRICALLNGVLDKYTLRRKRAVVFNDHVQRTDKSEQETRGKLFPKIATKTAYENNCKGGSGFVLREDNRYLKLDRVTLIYDTNCGYIESLKLLIKEEEKRQETENN